MSNLIFRAVALCVVFVLAGCATPARQQSMVPEIATEIKSTGKYASSVTVRNISGGKKTNPLWVSNISNQDFGASLTSALKRRGFFSRAGPYQLDVTLLNVKQPLFGADFTVTTVVRYELKDSGGALVFQKTISADYTAKFSDHLIGVERLRLANEGSARENIKRFLASLR